MKQCIANRILVVNTMRCSNCLLRYHCDEQTEFICKKNDFCKYIQDGKRHGHWETYYVCSKYGETVRTVLAECPCCHVKMDGLDI